MVDKESPKICKLLGLDIDETFSISDFGEEKFRFNECGHLCGTHWGEIGGKYTYLLCELINYPDILKRKPRWTDQDIEDAEAIRRLYVDAARVYRGENTKQCVYLMDMNAVPTGISFPRKSIFPSLRPGENVTLDEILEAEITG